MHTAVTAALVLLTLVSVCVAMPIATGVGLSELMRSNDRIYNYVQSVQNDFEKRTNLKYDVFLPVAYRQQGGIYFVKVETGLNKYSHLRISVSLHNQAALVDFEIEHSIDDPIIEYYGVGEEPEEMVVAVGDSGLSEEKRADDHVKNFVWQIKRSEKRFKKKGLMAISYRQKGNIYLVKVETDYDIYAHIRLSVSGDQATFVDIEPGHTIDDPIVEWYSVAEEPEKVGVEDEEAVGGSGLSEVRRADDNVKHLVRQVVRECEKRYKCHGLMAISYRQKGNIYLVKVETDYDIYAHIRLSVSGDQATFVDIEPDHTIDNPIVEWYSVAEEPEEVGVEDEEAVGGSGLSEVRRADDNVKHLVRQVVRECEKRYKCHGLMAISYRQKGNIYLVKVETDYDIYAHIRLSVSGDQATFVDFEPGHTIDDEILEWYSVAEEPEKLAEEEEVVKTTVASSDLSDVMPPDDHIKHLLQQVRDDFEKRSKKLCNIFKPIEYRRQGNTYWTKVDIGLKTYYRIVLHEMTNGEIRMSEFEKMRHKDEPALAHDISEKGKSDAPTSGVRPADDLINGFVQQVKGEFEDFSGLKVSTFVPIEYHAQGAMYFVKVDIGDGKFAHLRIVHDDKYGDVKLFDLHIKTSRDDKIADSFGLDVVDSAVAIIPADDHVNTIVQQVKAEFEEWTRQTVVPLEYVHLDRIYYVNVEFGEDKFVHLRIIENGDGNFVLRDFDLRYRRHDSLIESFNIGIGYDEVDGEEMEANANSGLSEVKPADDHIRQLVKQVKADFEKRSNKLCDVFKPLEYRHQGKNYWVKVDIGHKTYYRIVVHEMKHNGEVVMSEFDRMKKDEPLLEYDIAEGEEVGRTSALSAVKPVDHHVSLLVYKVKDDFMNKTKRRTDIFKPVEYRQQGQNYWVKVDVGHQTYYRIVIHVTFTGVVGMTDSEHMRFGNTGEVRMSEYARMRADEPLISHDIADLHREVVHQADEYINGIVEQIKTDYEEWVKRKVSMFVPLEYIQHGKMCFVKVQTSPESFAHLRIVVSDSGKAALRDFEVKTNRDDSLADSYSVDEEIGGVKKEVDSSEPSEVKPADDHINYLVRLLKGDFELRKHACTIYRVVEYRQQGQDFFVTLEAGTPDSTKFYSMNLHETPNGGAMLLELTETHHRHEANLSYYVSDTSEEGVKVADNHVTNLVQQVRADFEKRANVQCDMFRAVDYKLQGTEYFVKVETAPGTFYRLFIYEKHRTREAKLSDFEKMHN